MNTEIHDYRAVLREHFARRQGLNKHYSLRAFARDLGLSPGHLSHVLNGRFGL